MSSTSPTASPSTDSSPPPPDSTSPPPPSSTSPPPPSPTSPPPPSSTPPPPSTPASNPPPPSDPSPPPPASSPPPAPPTSSPPPPTPTSNPPPATPDASESPPTPASSSSSTPPPSPPTATPSPPTPVDATPVQDSSPATPALTPPQEKEKPISSDTPRTPSLSHNPPISDPGSQSSDTPDSSSSSGDQPGLDAGVIAGIVVGGVVIVALLMIIICLICNKKKRKPRYYMDPAVAAGTNQFYNQEQAQAQWHSSPNPVGNGGGGWGSTHMGHANTSGDFSSHPMGGISQFSYEELASATGGFCEANLLGQGGFGFVHKGILPDRREVAVKSLKSGSGQGEREFQAEVDIISRVHHRHLVSLVGYCIAANNKLLVYEYVPNNTMEFHLHGKGQPVLDWPTRLRIAIGSAKGLAYLHEDCLPKIIHRDIKAANILIDNNFEAMVADFGLAKLTNDTNTHVSTRVMGTFGYLAPEYASSGKLSEKSDVFSFGVMLLELITGRRPIDLTNPMEDSLVDWARPLLAKALEDGNYEELVDPRLEGKFLHQELSRMASCAAASIRHSARKRPKMSQIVRALEGDSSMEDLNEGVKPGQSAVYGGNSELYDTRAYNADMMQFKKMVMPTQEFDSSDFDSMEIDKKS